MPDVPVDERSERLTDEELESFYAYAERNMRGPTGDRRQWADYTVRLIEEVRHLREIEEAAREAPLLRDRTLEAVGAEIIVVTGNGELAAHVVTWLRKMANFRTALDADTGGQGE